MSETLLAVIIGGAISAATAAIGQFFQMKMLDAKQHKELAFKLMDKRLEVYEHLFELLDVAKFIKASKEDESHLKSYIQETFLDLLHYRGRYIMFASETVIIIVDDILNILDRLRAAHGIDIASVTQEFIDNFAILNAAVRKETDVQIVDTLHKSITKITDPKTHRTHDGTDNKTRNDGTH